MNIQRRRFLQNISLGGFTLFSAGLGDFGCIKSVSSDKGWLLLVTGYTAEVGQYVSEVFSDDAEYGSFKLSSIHHYARDPSDFSKSIQDKIEEECSMGQLYEFKGWVITKTEAFLSGMIVELA